MDEELQKEVIENGMVNRPEGIYVFCEDCIILTRDNGLMEEFPIYE